MNLIGLHCPLCHALSNLAYQGTVRQALTSAGDAPYFIPENELAYWRVLNCLHAAQIPGDLTIIEEHPSLTDLDGLFAVLPYAKTIHELLSGRRMQVDDIIERTQIHDGMVYS